MVPTPLIADGSTVLRGDIALQYSRKRLRGDVSGVSSKLNERLTNSRYQELCHRRCTRIQPIRQPGSTTQNRLEILLVVSLELSISPYCMTLTTQSATAGGSCLSGL